MPTSPSTQRKSVPGALAIVVLLLAISAFINYVDRGNLSIAAPMLKDELGIPASQLGVLLSAFFWTYACLQPFSGWLVDRWNVNWLLAGGFFLWSAATAATAVTQTLAGPQAAGRWTGLQNFVGNLAGVVAPAVTGLVLDRTGEFYWAFAIVTAVAFSGAMSFVFLVGPVERVIWLKDQFHRQLQLP